MVKLLSVAFLCISLSLTSPAQTYNYLQIDSLLSSWQSDRAPGFSIGIISHQKLEYAKGFGLANLSYGLPNTPGSVFRIASASKQFTAACIYLCAEQGLLRLDDPVTRFFPQLPDYARNIKIRHLVHHTSGLRDYLTLSYLAGLRDEDFFTDEEVMDWLSRQKELNFEPGSEYLYSNSGYWLLGQIVEKASGKNLADYARENIFTPLGMEHTLFVNDPNKVVKNLATGYTPAEEESNGFRLCMTTLPMIGDGGVHTSVEDMTLWLNEMLNHKTFGEDLWKNMTGVGILDNGDSTDYAGGLSIGSYQGEKTISHGGSFVGYLSYMLVFPGRGLAIIVLANRNDIAPGQIAYQVSDLLLGLGANPGTENGATASLVFRKLKPEEMIPFTGSYEIQEGVRVNITLKDDSLHVNQLWNGVQYNVASVTENRFVIPSSPEIVFEFNDMKDSKARQLVVDQSGEKITAHRVEEETAAGIVRLPDYAGKFYSEELSTVYELFIQNDSLFLKVKSSEPVYMVSSGEDLFRAGPATFRFSREKGEVKNFTINAGRVKGIVFRREK